MDLLAVQGTLKSLLQHHSSKASILQCSAFFIVQLSHPYMTTGKTMVFTRRTFVGKVMFLLFNMLSKFAITFLPKSKLLLISWLQSPSAVVLEPRKYKVSQSFHCFPIYLPWSDGTGCHDLGSWMLSLKPTFSLSSFTFIKRPLALHFPACASSSPTFLMMYSAYKLNKQGDNIQPWCTPFPICNQLVVPCPVLTVASWPAYRFLKRQVRWSGVPISFRIFHSLLWSTQSKALA